MKKIFYLFLIVSMFSSCSHDLLDLKPLDAISETDVFSDEKLLIDYVNANYNGIRDPFIAKIWNDCFSDNAQHTHGPRGVRTYNTGGITADNGESSTGGLWSHAYSYIRQVNVFFEKIDEAPIADNLKTRLSGEMKFVRAFVYAELIWNYGGVPIVNEIYDTNSEFKVTRDSYDDVVTFIVKELDDAALALPNSYDSETGRATKPAAMALKARVLLYAASELNNPSNDKTKWQAAADAAEAVIDLGFELHGDYNEVFTTSTSEAIWKKEFTKAKGHNYNLMNNSNGYAGWGGNTPLQDLVDEYEMSNGEPIFLADGSVNPASSYDPQNPYVDREPRFYATINYNGKEWKGREIELFLPGGLDTKDGPIAYWNASNTGYHVRKWLDENEPVSESEKSTTPYIFFRTGEMYLNYAEALIELEKYAEAKTYINLIRDRVDLPEITANGSELKELYRHERRIELAFEDHRLFDILRWKIAAQVLNGDALGVRISKNDDGSLLYEYDKVTQERAFDASKHYRFPIPRSEVDKTSGSIVQNPGYN